MANTATVEIIINARDQTTAAFGAVDRQLKSLEKQARAAASGLSAPLRLASTQLRAVTGVLGTMGSALKMVTAPVRILGSVLGTLANIAGTVVKGAFSALKTAVGWVRDQIDNLIEGCKRATVVFGGLAAAGAAVISKITMYAARTEELGIALAQVAQVTGHSTAEIQAQEKAVKALGITTQAARTLLMRMFAAEIDVAYATKIARAAQDLAVIGMRDSSEAAEDLIYAITSLQPRLIRKYGIYVTLVQVYQDAAKALGKEVEELTALEKRHFFMNAILEQAAAYTGTYEAAMTTAGKQIRSFRRYIEELMNQFGKFFLPILAEGVRVATEFVKSLLALPPATKELISRFLLAATAATGVIAGLAGLVVLVSKLAPLIKFLLNPFGLLITLLGVFIAHWLSTGDVVTQVSDLIQGKVIPALQAFWNALVSAVSPFISLLKPAIGYIISWMDTLVMLFRYGAETGNWEPFLRTVKVVIERVKELLQPFVDKLKETIEEWVQKAVDWWDTTGKPRLETALGTIWNLITEIIWPNYVEPALNWLIEHVKTWAETTGWPFLQKTFESLWSWIKDSLWPWLEDTAWPWIKEKLLWLMGEMEKWVETTGGPLLAQLAKTLWGAFWQSAAESIEIPEWLQEEAAKPAPPTWWIWPAPEYLGGYPEEYLREQGGKVGGYQYGGVVPGPRGRPQLAVVHGGETILPTHRGRLTIEIPIYLDGREIARVVDDRLADRLRAEGITL